MPPKKASTVAPKKAAAASAHGSYQDMIKEAITQLKERAGSSRQALKKYVQANNKIGNVTDAQFTALFNRAITKGTETGVFARPKGTSGTVKLGMPSAKKSSSPDATAKPAAKKAAAAPPKTKAAPAKKAAPKKTAAKKATTTKAAPKKAAAAKPKANSSKARKTAPAAPAVEEKKPVVLGTTKSGRVTKSTAAQPPKKAAAPKKKAAAPKKTAAKKSATPKKA